MLKIHSGSLVRLGDFCISLQGNHVLACTSLWGCKVGNIFAKIYSFMTNGSDPLKIWVSFHLLTFAHLGWCLWCEREGLSHCEGWQATEVRTIWHTQTKIRLNPTWVYQKSQGITRMLWYEPPIWYVYYASIIISQGPASGSGLDLGWPLRDIDTGLQTNQVGPISKLLQGAFLLNPLISA